MKFGRYFIAVLVCMGLLILFGDRGLYDLLALKGKVRILSTENARIACENEDLKEKIRLLRSNARYIEMVARSDLGMVRKGDIVYRFAD
jgi:cell division protein FtsB